ncbi:MAG: transcription antitermination factor NusB [Candidatus Beckwithbacteria bacterium]
MKSKFDPRHLKRINCFKQLFAKSFKNRKFDPETDKLISQNAPDWPVNKLNKVDLAILRLAINEMKNQPQTPPKVIIDEAIELGKTFGSAKTAPFINGVLGAIIKKQP